MAPSLVSNYLMPLDKFINGEDSPVSWKSVFFALCNSCENEDNYGSVKSFLEDKTVQDLLCKPFEAFRPPSVLSKASFGTKTSAINVTPSIDAQYDIKVIKQDSLWLSKTANIDEISALRVTVVESQNRCTAQLLGPFSDEEIANLQEAVGTNNFPNSTSLLLPTQGQQTAIIQEEFDRVDNRKLRILRTYLSERCYMWKCAEHIIQLFFLSIDVEESDKVKLNTRSLWLENYFKSLVIFLKSTDVDTLLLQYISNLRNNMQKFSSSCDLDCEEEVRETIEADWAQMQIIEAIHAMKLIWHFLVYTVELSSSQVTLEWYQFLQSFNFFENFCSGDLQLGILAHSFQTLSVTISVELLGNLSFIDCNNESYSRPENASDSPPEYPLTWSPKSISRLHSVILQAADLGLVIAGPTILAWSMLLKSIVARVENEKTARVIEDNYNQHLDHETTAYENLVEEIQATVEDDVIDYLARRAVNVCHVFETVSTISLRLSNTPDAFFADSLGNQMRNSFLNLIRNCFGVGYIPEIIEAIISILSGGRRYWDLVSVKATRQLNDPVVGFNNDNLLIEAFLKISQSRYPYESLPFLKIVRALASIPLCYGLDDPDSVLRFLDTVPVFTYTLPAEFTDYETTQEEENNNSVKLTRAVHLFEPRNKNLSNVWNYNKTMAVARNSEDFIIPAGTIGRIISESGPRVACWFHEYSALKYFGKLLETFLASSGQVDGTNGMPADRESVSEIVELFAIFTLSITQSKEANPDWIENANNVLAISSSGLSQNHDIVTVIFEIFEEELQLQSSCVGSNSSLNILVSCVHFIHAILPLSSRRVWPMLAKSGLLGVNRDEGRLSNIVEGTEVISGNFEFLISCSMLYESLLDDLATNALRRKISNDSSANFVGVQNIRTCSPDQSVAKILYFFTRYLVDVMEKSGSWKFQLDDDRRNLCRTILTAFEKVLMHVYGIEASARTTEKSRELQSKLSIVNPRENLPMMEVLTLSATHIVECFLSTSSGSLRFQPLLRSYFDGLESPVSTPFLYQSQLWKRYVISSIIFSKTLLRVSTFLKRPASQLEKLLFNSSCLVTRLYSIDDEYSVPIVNFLESLVLAASSHGPEPPSLLGHLGPHTARNFLRVLSVLDKPHSRKNIVTSIWSFLGTVVSSRQQWFSNYLLTGKTPRDTLKGKTTKTNMITLEKSLLTTALQSLTKITQVPTYEALAMLEFVALAQNFWPWTVCNAVEYAEFIKSIMEFVGNFTPPQLRQGNTNDSISACHQIKMAAFIAEILAMHLYHSRQTGVSVPLKNMLSNLAYYEKYGTSTPQYNASLHGLLKQNFEARYSGACAGDFKRSTLDSRPFGIDYFYDINLADKMLRLDQAWTGRNGDDGIRAEFERANVNLSLVDAHIALFQSWKLLSLELSSRILIEPELQRLFRKVISDSLAANCKAQPPEEIFCRLSQTRADFALVLTQRLLCAELSSIESNGLLKVVWKTICELRGNFDRPVPDSDTLYYRSLLKLLFLTIHAHVEARPSQSDLQEKSVSFSQISSISQIVIEVVRYVVSYGLREIITSIHDSPAESSPEDLALITGIFQSCLRIPGITNFHSQIMSIMVSNDTPNIVMRLFSWSDRLAINGDPIYGELSILFLLELSSVPMIAEQLAIEGLLTQISSSSIITYFHAEGVDSLSINIGSQRCYNIWARGILPLLLNLLDSVQQSIATEVAQFLNQFPKLLKKSEESLEAPLMNRLPDQDPKQRITLTACSEAHSLALIIFILNGFRDTLGGTLDIPIINWDTNAVLENVEFWLGSKALLRERILPTGEREVEMLAKSEESNLAVCELEERIVSEMKGIRDILGASDT
ncbi:unnamed protein product [Blumeria hordei]|uniref:Uncharacterized protein n=1 Tax=Blumeria hordei TaxID=2867405 RepID=A0A383UZ29_BLUHO|nr:unnamed protein product [Blumeria hordei]